MLTVGGGLVLELLVLRWWYEGGGDLQHHGGSGGLPHLVDYDGGQDGAQQLEGKQSKVKSKVSVFSVEQVQKDSSCWDKILKNFSLYL